MSNVQQINAKLLYLIDELLNGSLLRDAHLERHTPVRGS